MLIQNMDLDRREGENARMCVWQINTTVLEHPEGKGGTESLMCKSQVLICGEYQASHVESPQRQQS